MVVKLVENYEGIVHDVRVHSIDLLLPCDIDRVSRPPLAFDSTNY